MRTPRYITLFFVLLAGCGGDPCNNAAPPTAVIDAAALTAASTGELVIDDFNDASRYTAGSNALGFSTGDDGTMNHAAVTSGGLRLDYVNAAGYWYSQVNPAGRHIENFRWLQFHAYGSAGGERLQLGVKDISNRSSAVDLDPLKVTSEVRAVRVSDLAGADLTKAKSVVITPASSSGTVFIDDLKLKGVGNRRLYVWSTGGRTATELADFCDQEAVRELYLKLDLSDPATVRDYVGKLHARGLRVQFLGGDPSWAYDHQQDGSDRMAQFIDYNDKQATSSAERFDGVNFDVEWYSSPHDNTDKAGYDGWIALFQQWRTMVDRSAQPSTIQLGASIPYWLEPTSDHSFTNPSKIQGLTDYVTVMAYRDNADGIVDAVSTEVQNARALGTGLVIAVEFKNIDPTETFWDQSQADFDSATERTVATFNGEFSIAIHDIDYYQQWQAAHGG